MGKAKTRRKVMIGLALAVVMVGVALFYHLGQSNGAGANYRIAKKPL